MNIFILRRMIAEIIVDIAHSSTDKIFDYDCGLNNLQSGSRVIVPFANTKVEGIVIGLKNETKVPLNKLKTVIRAFDETPALTEESLKMTAFMRNKYHLPTAAILRLFLPSEMRKGKVREKLVGYLTINSEITLEDCLASLSKTAKARRAALLKAAEGKIKTADLKKEYGNEAVNALIKLGFLIATEERCNRSPYKNLSSKNNDFNLTEEQRNAVNIVENTKKKVTLIHGVTGSGKTAVYLRLIKNVVESGKSAIMLVPEISLTPQMLSSLRAEFGENAAILHSGLSSGERFDEWWRLRSGEAKIAVGARSAIFAPVSNLGIIIIDEEHDGSYESESAPRYVTSQIAEFRAEYNDCKLVLGSATPSIETYLKAKNGQYALAEMTSRINHKPLPHITVADMRREIKRGNSSPFSSYLKDELQKCLSNNNQAIIFLNRRGYSQKIICRECGYVATCENCDVALNYHAVGNVLKCHFCGAIYKMPKACPECGGVNINYVGTGTQKIVEELKKLYPSARILRMDNDTTQNKEGHLKILKAFAEKQADILVGTQMIAKGHDFPSVTLVGILDADMSLYFSDYRSGERTFQLITQVSGRSGRAEEKGSVVLQTFSPENSVLRFAVEYDYKGFFERESALRKSTSFPPFATIVRVMVESVDDNFALSALKNVYERLKELYSQKRDAFVFFNKMRSPIKKLNSKFRYQVLMRIKAGCDDVVDEVYNRSLPFCDNKTLVYVEINPANLS